MDFYMGISMSCSCLCIICQDPREHPDRVGLHTDPQKTLLRIPARKKWSVVKKNIHPLTKFG